jgi:dihydroorotate dehydrogenase (NAD+) catalytic subunit
MSLETKFCGRTLKNPTVLTSGILGTTGSILKKVAKEGAGAVTTKSLGLKPKTGWKNPIVVGYEAGLLNAVGLSNPGYENFKNQISIAKEGGAPVIVSIFGSDATEFAQIARKVGEYGADMIELNVSCPNVKKKIICRDSQLTSEVVSKVKESTKVPIITKLSPNVDDITVIAKAAEDAGTDALSMINTAGPGMVIDIEAQKPVLEFKTGGISGPAVRPIAVRCIYQTYEKVEVPILGIGGVSAPEHAIELIMAGARTVGIGTAVITHGIEVFRNVSEGIKKFMKSHGFSKIEEMVGVGHI